MVGGVSRQCKTREFRSTEYASELYSRSSGGDLGCQGESVNFSAGYHCSKSYFLVESNELTPDYARLPCEISPLPYCLLKGTIFVACKSRNLDKSRVNVQSSNCGFHQANERIISTREKWQRMRGRQLIDFFQCCCSAILRIGRTVPCPRSIPASIPSLVSMMHAIGCAVLLVHGNSGRRFN